MRYEICESGDEVTLTTRVSRRAVHQLPAAAIPTSDADSHLNKIQVLMREFLTRSPALERQIRDKLLRFWFAVLTEDTCSECHGPCLASSNAGTASPSALPSSV